MGSGLYEAIYCILKITSSTQCNLTSLSFLEFRLHSAILYSTAILSSTAVLVGVLLLFLA
jgi:hypothetical protein